MTISSNLCSTDSTTMVDRVEQQLHWSLLISDLMAHCFVPSIMLMARAGNQARSARHQSQYLRILVQLYKLHTQQRALHSYVAFPQRMLSEQLNRAWVFVTDINETVDLIVVVALCHSNSLSVISWQWYDAGDEAEQSLAYTLYQRKGSLTSDTK